MKKLQITYLRSEPKTKFNKFPQFEIFPKVHKEGNPGRPVLSSIACHTTKPHVKEHKSYVKNSNRKSTAWKTFLTKASL